MQSVKLCRRGAAAAYNSRWMATMLRGRHVSSHRRFLASLVESPSFTSTGYFDLTDERNLVWSDAHSSIKGAFGSYKQEYDLSLNDPELFWEKAADQVEWFQKPSQILDYDPQTNPYFPKWFTDGVINMSYNCLDVHVKNGRAHQDALVYDSPVTGVKERYTYQELLDQVSTLAGAMQDLGIEAGDRVGKYLFFRGNIYVTSQHVVRLSHTR